MGPEDTDETFDKDVFGDGVGFSKSGDHITVWDRDSNSRMSWDTDASGNYTGGGHSVDQTTGQVTEWT